MDQPSSRRQRPPRVLSADQQLMFDIRAKVNCDDNVHRFHDVDLLKDVRKTNHDTSDLMLAFHKVGGAGYLLEDIKKLHDMLSENGVERPSEFIDLEALRVGKRDGWIPLWRDWKTPPETAQLMSFALSSPDRYFVFELIEQRQITDIDEIKAILAETKVTHRSLTSGAL